MYLSVYQAVCRACTDWRSSSIAQSVCYAHAEGLLFCYTLTSRVQQRVHQQQPYSEGGVALCARLSSLPTGSVLLGLLEAASPL